MGTFTSERNSNQVVQRLRYVRLTFRCLTSCRLQGRSERPSYLRITDTPDLMTTQERIGQSGRQKVEKGDTGPLHQRLRFLMRFYEHKWHFLVIDKKFVDSKVGHGKIVTTPILLRGLRIQWHLQPVPHYHDQHVWSIRFHLYTIPSLWETYRSPRHGGYGLRGPNFINYSNLNCYRYDELY